MARVALAVLALLLASHGCAAVEDTTTIVDGAQQSTTDAPSPGPVSAAARASCVGPMLLALLALLLSGHGCAAVDDTTTVAEDLHLDLSTTDAPGPVSAALRASGLGPMLLALLAFLFAGHGCAAVDDTTTFADGVELSTTDAPSPGPVSAAPRASGLGPTFALGAALGLAARR
jgi:hypothetical protein